MRHRAPRRVAATILGVGALVALSLLLAACPLQPTYPATITPIYVATATTGLYVYNGTSWSSTIGGGSALTSVVVSGSGSGAEVFVGGGAGLWYSYKGVWYQGFSSPAVNGITLGSTIYAATATGISTLDAGGTSWTATSVGSAVRQVFVWGSFVYAAADTTGLMTYNNTGGATTIAPGSVVTGSSAVTSVALDSYGDLFVGTDKGLGISAGTAYSFPANQLPGAYHVYGIVLDTWGNLYVATDNGLYINLGATPVLSDTVSCVWVDGHGTIYAGVGTKLEVSTDGGSTWTTKLTAGSAITSIVTTAPLYSF